MRVIIACAGPQVKWNNHLGVSSHFAPVRVSPASEEREPLLMRTLGQVARYTRDVIITCPEGDARYCLGGVTTYVGHGSSEFDSSRDFWSEEDRTVLLLGDVYFSDLALRRIMGYAEHNYRVFGRHGGSMITHTPYGEIFAHSWWPEHHREIDRHLENVEAGRAEGIMRPHGWMLLRSFQGGKLNRHIVMSSYFTEINDWTDDIDFPEDFERHPATKGYKL